MFNYNIEKMCALVYKVRQLCYSRPVCVYTSKDYAATRWLLRIV